MLMNRVQLSVVTVLVTIFLTFSGYAGTKANGVSCRHNNECQSDACATYLKNSNQFYCAKTKKHCGFPGRDGVLQDAKLRVDNYDYKCEPYGYGYTLNKYAVPAPAATPAPAPGSQGSTCTSAQYTTISSGNVCWNNSGTYKWYKITSPSSVTGKNQCRQFTPGASFTGTCSILCPGSIGCNE